MNPLERAAALIAGAAHAVVAEYRRLDTPPPAPSEPARAEINCTAASTQVNTADPQRAYRNGRVSPPFGFGHREDSR